MYNENGSFAELSVSNVIAMCEKKLDKIDGIRKNRDENYIKKTIDCDLKWKCFWKKIIPFLSEPKRITKEEAKKKIGEDVVYEPLGGYVDYPSRYAWRTEETVGDILSLATEQKRQGGDTIFVTVEDYAEISS